MTTEPSARTLRRDGYQPVSFRELQTAAAAALATPPSSRTLEPLVSFDRWFPVGGRIAVLGVRLAVAGDLTVLTRFVLDPGYRRGCDLLVWADQPPTVAATLEDAPEMGHRCTLDRFQFLIDRYAARRVDDGLPPLTPIEERLLSALSQHGLRPRVQFGVGPFIVDFAFPERRLAVEADGRDWHDVVRDRQRDAALRECGWHVVHLTGSDIHRDPLGCVAKVAARYAELDRVPELSEPLDGRLSWWRRLLKRLLGRAGRTTVDSPLPSREPRSVVAHDRLDVQQLAAVTASDGVTQVIAPAGSGKTTVLVERVIELLGRGVPANRIVCATFNRAARAELRERLQRSGVPDLVDVHTFHGLGRRILKDDGVLPRTNVQYAWGEWRKLAGEVAREEGMTYLDAPDASTWVSRFKLVDLAWPDELRGTAGEPIERSAREIYRRYQADVDRRDGWDFDDLVFRSVRYLHEDPLAGQRWQDRWWCVLVDEYQDIEPAQELLIRLLAAPHECLFVVGDEDQCIYAWRRASVERIVQLDQVYPTLDRVVLERNYRCATSVVAAADALIRHNQVRFPKQIKATRLEVGTISLEGFADGSAEVAAAATWLAEQGEAGSAAVIARTTAQLREVAMGCLDAGIPISAEDRILRLSNAERAVLAYLSICWDPLGSTLDDVLTAFRFPNRYLPDALAGQFLAGRRRDRSFAAIVQALPRMEEWRRTALVKAAPLLDQLAVATDAAGAVHLLRGDLGLDNHFTSRDQLIPTEHDGRDALDQITSLAAAARSTEGLIQRLRQRRQRLQDARSEDGCELTTIHGAKGREWDALALVGADADVMPHQRALQDAEGDADAVAKVREDERRLAYVACTRARDHLRITWTGAPSPFHFEAGLLGGTREGPPAPPGRGTREGPPAPPGRGTRGGPPAPPGRGTPSSPTRAASRTIPAQYPSVCVVCRGPIGVGDPIVRHGPTWVHEACAGAPEPPPF